MVSSSKIQVYPVLYTLPSRSLSDGLQSRDKEDRDMSAHCYACMHGALFLCTFPPTIPALEPVASAVSGASARPLICFATPAKFRACWPHFFCGLESS
ncbi:hypothetical protein V6N13_011370 [Hibiscus sabdariffa]